jgi:uncharacterized lipoprotein YbaY
MKKLLIAAVLTLAACSDERPAPAPLPAPTAAPVPACPSDDRSAACVWPDGQPK